ncbi:recombinase family protein [Selenomonas sp. AB3002]|uniref:recombinase family protein n=1 Tax=Selenomonas sp. AB3002 TaxID=1392502 RepID=UPI00049567B3
MGNIYGYARVSTREQNTDRQVLSLRKAKVPNKCILIDRVSGKDFQRPAYQRLLKKLKKGSLLYIHSLDRLGRNYQEIIREWRRITKEKGADIVVLDMPLLDTRKGKDLIGTFLSDLVLQILSFVAENERTSIRQRQAEGIAAAKERGVRFGRPQRKIPQEFYRQCEKWRQGKVTLAQAAEKCGMPASTFYYKARHIRN